MELEARAGRIDHEHPVIDFQGTASGPFRSSRESHQRRCNAGSHRAHRESTKEVLMPIVDCVLRDADCAKENSPTLPP
jgi:hypothetical protein